jgi:hypothetical protein
LKLNDLYACQTAQKLKWPSWSTVIWLIKDILTEYLTEMRIPSEINQPLKPMDTVLAAQQKNEISNL